MVRKLKLIPVKHRGKGYFGGTLCHVAPLQIQDPSTTFSRLFVITVACLTFRQLELHQLEGSYRVLNRVVTIVTFLDLLAQEHLDHRLQFSLHSALSASVEHHAGVNHVRVVQLKVTSQSK